MSDKKRSSSRRATAANARETAKRFGLRLQGATREGVVILLLAACVFLLLALYSFRRDDPGWSSSGPETEVANWMGAVGAWLADVLYSLFGVSALWWPGMLGFAAWWLIRSRQVRFEWDPTALAVRCGGWCCCCWVPPPWERCTSTDPTAPCPTRRAASSARGWSARCCPWWGRAVPACSQWQPCSAAFPCSPGSPG